MVIVAFSGEAGTGKDTCAEVLIKNHQFKKLSFAQPLKTLLAKSFDISPEQFEDRDLKDKIYDNYITITAEHINSFLDGIDNLMKIEYNRESILDKFAGKDINSVRQLMQIIGTELVRNNISKTFWIDLLKKQLNEIDSNIVITDARLKNERDVLRQLGAILVRVKRPGLILPNSHSSELDFGDDSEYSVVIENTGHRITLQSEIDMWWTFRKKLVR